MLSSMGKVDHDTAINMLIDKICPNHNCEMPFDSKLFIPPDYVRNKYRCPYCRCGVDYVGDEVKPDSIGLSLHCLNQDGFFDIQQKLLLDDNVLTVDEFCNVVLPMLESQYRHKK